MAKRRKGRKQTKSKGSDPSGKSGSKEVSLSGGESGDADQSSIALTGVPYLMEFDSIGRGWQDTAVNSQAVLALQEILNGDLEGGLKRVTATRKLSDGQQTELDRIHGDLPLNPLSLSRYLYWKHDHDADEWDPAEGLEPSSFLIEALSLSFGPSLRFARCHVETEALAEAARQHGVAGVVGESAIHAPLYNLNAHNRAIWQPHVAELGLDPVLIASDAWTIAAAVQAWMTQMFPAAKFEAGKFVDSTASLSPNLLISKEWAKLGYDAYGMGAGGSDAWGNQRYVIPYIHLNNLTATMSVAATSVAAEIGIGDGVSFESEGTTPAVEATSSAPPAIYFQAGPIENYNNGGLKGIDAWDGTTLPYSPLTSVPNLASLTPFGPVDAVAEIETQWSGGQFHLWTCSPMSQIKLLEVVSRRISSLARTVVEAKGRALSAADLVGTGDMSDFGWSMMADLLNLQSEHRMQFNPVKPLLPGQAGPVDRAFDITLDGNRVVTGISEYGFDRTARDFWETSPEDVQTCGDRLRRYWMGSKVSLPGYPDGLVLTDAFATLDSEFLDRAYALDRSSADKIEKHVVLPGGVADASGVYASGVQEQGRDMELLVESLLRWSGSTFSADTGVVPFTDVHPTTLNPLHVDQVGIAVMGTDAWANQIGLTDVQAPDRYYEAHKLQASLNGMNMIDTPEPYHRQNPVWSFATRSGQRWASKYAYDDLIDGGRLLPSMMGNTYLTDITSVYRLDGGTEWDEPASATYASSTDEGGVLSKRLVTVGPEAGGNGFQLSSNHVSTDGVIANNLDGHMVSLAGKDASNTMGARLELALAPTPTTIVAGSAVKDESLIIDPTSWTVGQITFVPAKVAFVNGANLIMDSTGVQSTDSMGVGNPTFHWGMKRLRSTTKAPGTEQISMTDLLLATMADSYWNDFWYELRSTGTSKCAVLLSGSIGLDDGANQQLSTIGASVEMAAQGIQSKYLADIEVTAAFLSRTSKGNMDAGGLIRGQVTTQMDHLFTEAYSELEVGDCLSCLSIKFIDRECLGLTGQSSGLVIGDFSPINTPAVEWIPGIAMPGNNGVGDDWEELTLDYHMVLERDPATGVLTPQQNNKEIEFSLTDLATAFAPHKLAAVARWGPGVNGSALMQSLQQATYSGYAPAAVIIPTVAGGARHFMATQLLDAAIYMHSKMTYLRTTENHENVAGIPYFGDPEPFLWLRMFDFGQGDLVPHSPAAINPFIRASPAHVRVQPTALRRDRQSPSYLTDTALNFDQQNVHLGLAYAETSPMGGSRVLTREAIRYIQTGKQYARL